MSATTSMSTEYSPVGSTENMNFRDSGVSKQSETETSEAAVATNGCSSRTQTTTTTTTTTASDYSHTPHSIKQLNQLYFYAQQIQHPDAYPSYGGNLIHQKVVLSNSKIQSKEDNLVLQKLYTITSNKLPGAMDFGKRENVNSTAGSRTFNPEIQSNRGSTYLKNRGKQVGDLVLLSREDPMKFQLAQKNNYNQQTIRQQDLVQSNLHPNSNANANINTNTNTINDPPKITNDNDINNLKPTKSRISNSNSSHHLKLGIAREFGFDNLDNNHELKNELFKDKYNLYDDDLNNKKLRTIFSSLIRIILCRSH